MFCIVEPVLYVSG